ncbi:unnamed protein product, partial [Oppiella nova]
RAVYHGSDIYLLDDPLAAVDAHVGQHLFQRVIGPKGLLRNTTRILATHHMEFLREADHILVLSEGRVVESGGYDELAERGVLSDHEFNESDNQSKGSGDQMSRQTSRVSESESTAQLLRQISMTQENEQKITENEVKNSQLIDKETEKFGSIKMSVYLDYLRRIPLIYTLIPFMSAFLFNACEVGANFWLNIWTTHNSTQVDNTFYLSVYLSAIVLEAMFVLTFQMMLRTGAVIAAGVLHKDMLSCILRTPLSFFDVTPLGRILNRFNRDFEQIDVRIPWCLGEALFHIIYFLYIVAIVVYMNAYMTILILIIVINLFVDFETIKSFKFHHSVTDL